MMTTVQITDKVIARIVKVNHAGEFGAIRTYRAQMWLARRLYPDVLPFVEETLAHEIDRCACFRAAMQTRAAPPCRVMSFWGLGGYVLGFFTGLAGRRGIWICTEAVEATVHRHREEQLFFLKTRDRGLEGIIASIRDEELGHLAHATERILARNIFTRMVSKTIAAVTETLICLSTWGDYVRMARDLSAHRLREQRPA